MTHPLSSVALQRTEPLYLTNAMCEHAHGDAALFKALGLRSGSWRGEFYPLTKDESLYISDDSEPFEHATLLLGYTVLLQGQKWLAPSIEFDFRDRDVPDAPSKEDALQRAKRFLAAIEGPVRELGGSARLDAEAGGPRHAVMLLLPFAAARRFPTYAAWRKRLVDLVSTAFDGTDCPRAR